MSGIVQWLLIGVVILIALIVAGRLMFVVGASADDVTASVDGGMDDVVVDEVEAEPEVWIGADPPADMSRPPDESGQWEKAGPPDADSGPDGGYAGPEDVNELDFGPPPLAVLDPREYRVWFGTNRAPNDPADLSKGFSGERGAEEGPEEKVRVYHGYCDVLVPKAHKTGSTGDSTWWSRLVTGVDDRLKLNRTAVLEDAAYWQAVAAQIAAARPGSRDALIYIHGYKNSFEDAAIKAAQIGFDLGIAGAMAFFSWPSRGALDDYSTDEDSILGSEKEIAAFIADFAEKSGAPKVHILAHSMGNRGLLRAVNEIVHGAAKRENCRFGEVILAAADVDAKNFRDYSPAYGEVAAGTTLYVSAKDKAVGFSSWKHGGYPRIGYSPPIQIFPRIETVCVDELDMDFLGHGYIAAARPVLEDIGELIRNGARAAQRTGHRLDQRQDEKGRTYWAVRA